MFHLTIPVVENWNETKSETNNKRIDTKENYNWKYQWQCVDLMICQELVLHISNIEIDKNKQPYYITFCSGSRNCRICFSQQIVSTLFCSFTGGWRRAPPTTICSRTFASLGEPPTNRLDAQNSGSEEISRVLTISSNERLKMKLIFLMLSQPLD